MLKAIFKYVLVITAALLAGQSHSDTTVYGLNIKNRLSDGNNDHYNQLWQSMAAQDLKFDLEIVPSMRLVKELSTDLNGCGFPVIASMLEQATPNKALKLISSESVDYEGIQVFTINHNSDLTDISSLANLSLAGSFGFDKIIAKNKLEGKNFTKVSDDERLLIMLYKKRIDAILAYTPDILIAAYRLHLPPPTETGIWVVEPQGVGLVCHDTPSNREFIEGFNHLLNGMQKSGELRRILGPYVALEKP